MNYKKHYETTEIIKGTQEIHTHVLHFILEGMVLLVKNIEPSNNRRSWLNGSGKILETLLTLHENESYKEKK